MKVTINITEKNCLPDGGDEFDEPEFNVYGGSGGSVPGLGQLHGSLAEAVHRGGVLDVHLLVPVRHLLQEDSHHGQSVAHALCDGLGDVVIDLVVVDQVQFAVEPDVGKKQFLFAIESESNQ